MTDRAPVLNSAIRRNVREILRKQFATYRAINIAFDRGDASSILHAVSVAADFTVSSFLVGFSPRLNLAFLQDLIHYGPRAYFTEYVHQCREDAISAFEQEMRTT